MGCEWGWLQTQDHLADMTESSILAGTLLGPTESMLQGLLGNVLCKHPSGGQREDNTLHRNGDTNHKLEM